MELIRYTCAACGEEHEGLPDVAFDSPYSYRTVPAAERGSRAVLTSDTCVIDDEDYFVRACLPIPIRGTEAEFAWGAWVSLSEANFRRYVELDDVDPPEDEGPYFGWFCNRLPGYPETLGLKTQVHLQAKGRRPLIELQPTDHPLAIHQRDGIELRELLAILGDRVHGATTRSGDGGGASPR